MHITLVAGARPNFMKVAPIIDAIGDAYLNGRKITYQLVHTGQHYDRLMSESFFEELEIPEPTINLESGSGTQAEQTANIMVRFERFLFKNPTDMVVVVGDVTSTLACTIVAKKLGIEVAHVEGGIRCGDSFMPEEINRIVTDSISDLFFTTSKTANDNLLRSGVSPKKIHFVGNTMIDCLLKNRKKFYAPQIWHELNLKRKNYFILTIHRCGNVDDEQNIENLIFSIMNATESFPVVFPVHPRTAKKLPASIHQFPNLHLVEPLSYLQFNFLVENSKGVITDSGGITEETTVMGIPCITLRNNTERPETKTEGTNELVGTNPIAVSRNIKKIIENNWKKGSIPELWDGNAAKRIVKVLLQHKYIYTTEVKLLHSLSDTKFTKNIV